MSNLTLSLTSNDAARIEFNAIKMGNFLTSGNGTRVGITLEDEKNLRDIQRGLFHMRQTNPNDIAFLTISGTKYSMDSSIWHDLADALFGYIIHRDLSKNRDLMALIS